MLFSHSDERKSAIIDIKHFKKKLTLHESILRNWFPTGNRNQEILSLKPWNFLFAISDPHRFIGLTQKGSHTGWINIVSRQDCLYEPAKE